MIKAIIFDCFGVLTTDLLMEFTRTLPEAVMPEVHDTIHQRSSGILSKEEFVDQLTRLTGQDKKKITEVTRPGGHKNEELFRYIKELKGQGYQIGLLSNVGSNWVREEFLSKEELKLFDDILLSYEVNLVKPDPKIFQLAAKRLGVDMKETVLVDDIDRYCGSARAEGMKAIVYQNFEQTKQDLQKLLAKG
jgi:epoxide hydrolase-like predicted phosphatase